MIFIAIFIFLYMVASIALGWINYKSLISKLDICNIDPKLPTWVILTLPLLEEESGGGEIVPLYFTSKANTTISNIIVYSNHSKSNRDEKLLCLINKSKRNGVQFIQRIRTPGYMLPFFTNYFTDFFLFRDLSPSVVHQHSVSDIFFTSKLAAFTCGVSSIYTTFHRYPSLRSFYIPKQMMKQSMINRYKDFYFESCNRLMATYIDHQIFCFFESDGNSYQHEMGLSKKKIQYIPNGIDMDVFCRDFQQDEVIKFLRKRKIIFEKETIVVGFIGRMLGLKGPLFLVKAMRDVLDHHKNVAVIYFGGEGSQTELIINYMDHNRYNCPELSRKIIFAGSVDYIDVPLALSAIDIYAMPSIVETMPLGLIEAMAAKKAVVASDIAGINSIILDGYTGILFKSCDYRELAQHINALVTNTDHRKTLGLNAHKEVIAKYNVNSMVEKYEKQYLHNWCSDSNGTKYFT